MDVEREFDVSGKLWPHDPEWFEPPRRPVETGSTSGLVIIDDGESKGFLIGLGRNMEGALQGDSARIVMTGSCHLDDVFAERKRCRRVIACSQSPTRFEHRLDGRSNRWLSHPQCSYAANRGRLRRESGRPGSDPADP